MKKRKIEVVVISDVHLGSAASRAEELLVYLSSIKPKILVLNGNFIEPVQGRKNTFPKSHIKVIKKILSLVSEGTKVYYVTGHRDELFRKINGRIFNKLYFQDKVVLDLDGKNTCILHGSMFDTSPVIAKWFGMFGSMGYKFLDLKRRLRQRWFSPKTKNDLSVEIKTKPLSTMELSRLSKFDRTAADMALQNNYDTLICGYSHHPRKSLYESRKGRCLYLNSGDWTVHMTALEYSFKRWKVYSFKLDKLTAFYGDEELSETGLPELMHNLKVFSKKPVRTRTAS